MSSRKKTNPLPARVISMIVMVAIMVGGLFGIFLSNWTAGILIGVGFAGGIYFAVIFQARRSSGRKRRS